MKCSSNIATRIYGLFVIACQILFFTVLAFLYDEFTFGFRLIRHMPYEEFIWIIQHPSHNTVVTTSCYLLRDILSCGSLFGIVHLLLRSPIRNRWKIVIPGIGFVILAVFLFFVVPSIDHIRLYMEFIPMEIISLDLLVILVLQKNLKEAYS